MESLMTCRAQDRRQSRRRAGVKEHGIVAVRIRPGYEALMVDASADGVLIETAHRLMPGRAVELLMETSTSTEVVRGRVLRSAVVDGAPFVDLISRRDWIRSRPRLVCQRRERIPCADRRIAPGHGLSGRRYPAGDLT